MNFPIPSRAFDDAVAAICHGQVSDEQIRGLKELLNTNPAARDEYILRLEIHSRLASEPDLFVGANLDVGDALPGECELARMETALRFRSRRRASSRKLTWTLALAACVAVFAAGFWGTRFGGAAEKKGATSRAIAMLYRTVDVQWAGPGETPRLRAPLEPGWLRLTSGLAQIVFYSGARVAIEGPAELEIISESEIACHVGRLTAEVPPPARGFRIRTAQINATELGPLVGLDVQARRTEVHVLKGSLELQPVANTARQTLPEGAGAVVENQRPLRLIAADATAFASLFDLQRKSLAAETQSYDQWLAASSRLNRDPSLLVYFDFQNIAVSDWRLRNSAKHTALSDATIVGCQWVGGRWPGKRALGFQSVSDRVRLTVPGEFDSLTLAAWVRVQGLDRKFNSLFMCDGFEAGEIHWLIRNDGVLSMTVKGPSPGNFQIIPSAPELTLDQLGLWVHVAVVLDGNAKRVIHYVNGRPVSERALRLEPPFHIGAAELGNWETGGFAGDDDAFLIRNFSGAMDEFCLFGRSLSDTEMQKLYVEGRPDLERGL